MSKEQRLAIAKDVIANIEMIHHVAKGHYFVGEVGDIDLTADPQAEIDKIAGRCTVCALGALFISAIRQFNEVKMCDITYVSQNRSLFFTNNPSLRFRLATFFDRGQLALIEAAFECWSTSDGGTAARDLGKKYLDPKQRLIAIMQNIITNDGDFKP